MIRSELLSDIDGVRHGFFTREGGYSEGIYASLNCGFGSGDDKARVERNRDKVAGALGVTVDRLITAWQWHGTDVLMVAAPWDIRRPPEADAMVTSRPGIALGVLTADCTPVLFADRDARAVGVAHAGWKGALAGVIEATVAAFGRLGVRPDDLHAAVGPSIGQASYEVGPEFFDRFVAADPDNARFFVASPRPGHHRFDLPGFVRSRLTRAGIGEIGEVGICTYADEPRFFSYRRTTHRGEPDYGRQISAIVLDG